MVSGFIRLRQGYGVMPRKDAFLLVILFLLLALPAFAATTSESILPDTAEEARAHSLGNEIRCVVCQSESINDSQADMARDLRALVREKISTGMSDDEVREFLRARYGDFILLKPPVQANTYALWGFPLFALAAGGLFAAAYFKKHRKK